MMTAIERIRDTATALAEIDAVLANAKQRKRELIEQLTASDLVRPGSSIVIAVGDGWGVTVARQSDGTTHVYRVRLL